MSYSDVLENGRTNESLCKLGEVMVKIKKYQKCETMLELQKSHKGKSMEYKETIGSLRAEQARIKLCNVINEKTAVSKDLNDAMNKEEIVVAINSSSPWHGINSNSMKTMRIFFAGT